MKTRKSPGELRASCNVYKTKLSDRLGTIQLMLGGNAPDAEQGLHKAVGLVDDKGPEARPCDGGA
ncbi:hypothetical protein D3C76_1772710 [compost metagenome]